MKMLKRLGAIAIAAVMLAAVGGIPAAADTPPTTPTTGSITINDKSAEHNVYSAYSIAGFDVITQNGATTFTNFKMDPINGKAYSSAISSALGFTPSSPDDIFSELGKLTDEADKVKATAIALRDAVTSNKITTTHKSVDGKIGSLPAGYYLVLENKTVDDGTTLSSPMLISVPNKDGSYNVVINAKNSKAGIVKKIREHDSKGNPILVDSSTAAIGDTVNYQSIAEIPTYPQDNKNITYYVTDTFCKALDFEPSSIDSNAVTIIDSTQNIKQTLVKDTDYKLETSGIDNATFRITLLNSDSIRKWGNAGYRLKITYSATLNSSANTGKAGNPNSTNLTYSTKPGNEDNNYTTPNDLVITYTYKLVVTKTDNGTNRLPNATFELSRFDGTTNKWIPIDTQVTADKTDATRGTATFTKLQQGTYQLVETAAPAGYAPCAPITFTVGATNDGNYTIPNEKFALSAKDNTEAIAKILATWSSKLTSQSSVTLKDNEKELDAAVQDSPTFVLPGTGGIGNTIFTVSGIAILLVGSLLAFLYYKKKKDSRQQ